MDAMSLLPVVITVAVTLFSLAVAAVVSLVAIGVPLFVVYRALKNGAQPTVIVSGGLANAIAQDQRKRAAVKDAEEHGEYVKRSQCPACGSPKVRRSLSAYVYCDFCGQLMDWDFQACLADKRSRMPGPQYEALLRQLQPRLTQARAAGDRTGYEGLQRKLYARYVQLCPAACPPRIGDPAYRDAFVAYSAASQTLADFSPQTTQTFAEQQRLTGALQWDRANPFAPKVQPASFWPLLDAVMAHQRATADLIVAEGLLETHPDRPTREVMVKIGASVMAQGWISYLSPDDREKMLAVTGLQDEFAHVPPPKLEAGPCPCCGAPLEVVEGARRVVCHHCGHMVGVRGGAMPCHGCGGQVEVPSGTSLFSCPHCDAELRMMRAIGA